MASSAQILDALNSITVRFQITMKLPGAIALTAWADSRNRNRSDMGAQILYDRTMRSENLRQAQKHVESLAEIAGCNPDEAISHLLAKSKLGIEKELNELGLDWDSPIRWAKLLEVESNKQPNSLELESLSLEALAEACDSSTEELRAKLKRLLSEN